MKYDNSINPDLTQSVLKAFEKVQVPIIKENLIKIIYEDLSKSDIVDQLWNDVYQANIRKPKPKIPMLSEVQDTVLKDALYEHWAESKSEHNLDSQTWDAKIGKDLNPLVIKLEYPKQPRNTPNITTSESSDSSPNKSPEFQESNPAKWTMRSQQDAVNFIITLKLDNQTEILKFQKEWISKKQIGHFETEARQKSPNCSLNKKIGKSQ